MNVSKTERAQPDLIDPHCVPVTPADDLKVDVLPSGNILLTITKLQVDVTGEFTAVVVQRVEWPPGALRRVCRKMEAVLDGGPLATMTAANVLAG